MESGLAVDYWTAPIMSYYKKYSEDKLVEFLKKLDNKLSSDWITGITPTKRIDSVCNILKKIEVCESPEELLASDCFKIDNSKFKYVIEGDLFGRSFAKYILLKLDLIIGNSKDIPILIPNTISIEHILPQHPKKDSQWFKDFSEEEREEWTDKLGNLTLISRRKNSSLSNLDYIEKRKKYFKKDLETFPNTVRILGKYKEKWQMNELKENHKTVIDYLLNAYK